VLSHIGVARLQRGFADNLEPVIDAAVMQIDVRQIGVAEPR